jgi:hypothetical protein
MAGDPERVDEWDEQRAQPAPAAAGPIPVGEAPDGERDAAPGDAPDAAPPPTWRQMARTTPAWVWAIGCGGALSICAMFFVTMLLIFTVK